MNLLIVAATEAETGLLKRYLMTQPDKKVNLLITGVGMLATAYALTKHLQHNQYDFIIQAGVGGSFDRSIPLGSLVFITSDRYGDLGAEDHDNYIDIFDMGLMDKRDFDNYMSLYNTIQQLISPPDLLIYLKGSIPALVNQIQKRGRSFEDSLRLDYLKKLNQRYDEWADQYKGGRMIIVNIDELDFSEKKEDLNLIIEMIENERSVLQKIPA